VSAYASSAETPGGMVELHLANWGERFVAWLIDVLIIGAVVFIIRVLVAVPTFAPVPVLDVIPFVGVELNNIFLFVYWLVMESIYNQSIGKMVMRIKVTTLEGNCPGIGQIAIESVGKAFLLVIDLIIGVALYPRKRQRIFNYISRTIVVRLR
jgi:uncharacterized RDD family membrane protein YckC